ncbi:MAG: Anti-anti-sigma regulatory factor (antagonist of anti-sigma factor)-like protein [Actinomycetia bacterium]|nr:Anti-anti-sigma regulatory factor (antagonist of anti-sigma factor)-like protein [Actinomycetes bacterium]
MTHPATEDIGPITITVGTERDSTVIASLGGELDLVSAPAVRERLLSLLSPDASRLVVDMSAIRYADASGLAVLVSTQRRAVLLGGTLRLAALQPEVARMLKIAGLSRHLAVYPTVQAAIAGRRRTIRTAHLVPSQAAARPLPAQAQAELGPDSGELRAAVTALLANADAWHDADPRRRFSPALRALAQANAGTSYAVMAQAAQSLLSVLSREPLTYSPAVAATAGRLRGLFAPRPRLARG